MGERPRQACEDLAGDVLGVVLVADDRQHVAEDVVRVEQVQQAQRVIVSVTGALGRGGDQRLRVRRMDELTAAPVSRPRRRRLETVRRTAHRHLSHSLRDEQPCPCPKSPPSLTGVGQASHRSAPELKSDMRPVDACPYSARCAVRRARSAISGTPSLRRSKNGSSVCPPGGACRSPRGRSPTSTARASCTSAGRSSSGPSAPRSGRRARRGSGSPGWRVTVVSEAIVLSGSPGWAQVASR